MKRLIFLVSFTIFILDLSAQKGKEHAFVNNNLQFASQQLQAMLDEPGNALRFPRTIDKNGKLVTTNMYDWTPGFFPGSLWYIFEFTGDKKFQTAATTWTEKLEPLRHFTGHHDLGFMVYCSYGNAYRITGNPAYKELLIDAARALSTRFSPTTGSIKSWNRFNSWHGNASYSYPVIIDNLMNLELLFFASKITGDTTFRHIAISHALTAMKNQLRDDYSSYHVVCYDSLTGKVVAKETAQGYADNSTWARGQAWGIYGYTMIYRETKDPRFLKTAEGMANYFINHKNLPGDKIPYWDFNANQKGFMPGIKSHANEVNTKFRDASAAAITTSALLELSRYSPEHGKKYRQAAVKMLHSLGSPTYRSAAKSNGNFILMHSVGSIPHQSEIDVPLVYADYYFLEALMRYRELLKS